MLRSAGAGEEKDLSPSLQNPILRKYFRKQYVSMHSGDLSGPPHQIEDYIDRGIQHFLERVGKKLDRVASDRKELEAARQGLQRAAGTKGDPQAVQRFRLALRQVGKSSDALRRMLSFVFVTLKRKSDLKLIVAHDDANPTFEREVRFIQENLESAERRIREYFFLHTATVQAAELRDKSMLTCLYQARQMARRLEKEL
ncbi:MAG: hypothetical protein ACE5JX_10750 [Acidobacteriota bacterium]